MCREVGRVLSGPGWGLNDEAVGIEFDMEWLTVDS